MSTALERLSKEVEIAEPGPDWNADGEVTVKYKDLALALAVIAAARNCLDYSINHYMAAEDMWCLESALTSISPERGKDQ